MDRYKTIDAYVAGESVRLLVEGAPTIVGRTMDEKLGWLRTHGEPLRQALMLEPRGHAGMHGALLTEPVLPKAHAGLLSMHAAGFPLVSGEGVMAAVAIALEQKILQVDSDDIYVDTPAGLLTAHPLRGTEGGGIGGVSVVGLVGFVQSAALPVHFGGRVVPVDVAFCGEFYAIVDSEAVGLPIDVDHAPELVRTGARLQQAVDAALKVTDPGLSEMHGVIFTAPGQHGGHLRSATVMAGGVLRRSPGVTGTGALMAVLDAMGILNDEYSFINESLIGTLLYGRVARRQHAHNHDVIFPQIESTVWITGHHEFMVEAHERSSFRI